MKKNPLSKQIGLQGERILEVFLGSLNIPIPYRDYFFDSDIEKNATVHPIKIHQENDYGVDFDVEVFWNKSEDSEPSGIHFFIQLKSTIVDEKPDVTLDLKNLSYFDRQANWRSVLIVWQKLERNKLECCIERKVIDYKKWRNNPETSKKINRLYSGQNESISIGQEGWEKLGDDWMINYIQRLMLPIENYFLQPLFSLLGHKLTYLEGYFDREIGVTNVFEPKYVLGGYQLPAKVFEKNSKRLATIGIVQVGGIPDLTDGGRLKGVKLPDIIDAINYLKAQKMDGILIICNYEIPEHLIKAYKQVEIIDERVLIIYSEKVKSQISAIGEFAKNIL